MAKSVTRLSQRALFCVLACLLVAFSATASPRSAASKPAIAEPVQKDGHRDLASASWSSLPISPPSAQGAAPQLESGSSSVNDGSFENGNPNATWMESSAGGFPVICSGPSCSSDAPRTGDWFAWFGGISGPETSSVSQIFFLDPGHDLLSFWIRLDNCDQDGAETDLFSVSIANTVIFELDENSARCGVEEHQRIVIDISSIADSSPYLLEFEFTGFGPALSNFYLDDVEILSSIETAVNPVDGGLEAGAPNSSWSEFSTNFGTPICDVACSSGIFAPRTGAFGAWFGGFAGMEDSSLAQIVTIPVDQTALSFWLRAQQCDGNSDNVDSLRLEIDGVPFLTFDEDSSLCEAPSYSRHIVDISQWADGGTHEVAFRYNGFGPGPTNFFVDDIEILSSLEAYFPFDTDAMDHSGNGRHATLENGATLGDGIVGGALDLTQSDGWADIVAPVLDRHTECTIAYSIKVESTTPGSPSDPCCNTVFAENDFPTGALHSNLNLGFGPPAMEWSVGGWSDGAFSPPLPSVESPSWMHFAMTYRPSLGEVKVYQDGVLVETIEETTPFCGAGLSSQIGAWENGPDQSRFLDARIDEMWIYSRVLTAEEIQDLVTPFFADDFESGTTAAWSMVVGGSTGTEVLMSSPER